MYWNLRYMYKLYFDANFENIFFNICIISER